MKITDAKYWLGSLKDKLSDAGVRAEYIEALNYAIETCGQYGWFVRRTHALTGETEVERREFPEATTREEALHDEYKVWLHGKKTMFWGEAFEEYKLFYAPIKKNGEPDESLAMYEVDIARLDDRMEKMVSAIEVWGKEHGRTLIAAEDFPWFSPISRRWMWELKDVETGEGFYAAQWTMGDGVQIARKLS